MKKVKEKQGKMDLTDLSTAELAIFSAKTEQQLGELQVQLKKIGRIRANGIPTFDADAKYHNKIMVKMTELGDLHNEIHYEIERRVFEKTGVDMEFEAIAEICYAIDDKYYQVMEQLDSATKKKTETTERQPLILKPKGQA